MTKKEHHKEPAPLITDHTIVLKFSRNTGLLNIVINGELQAPVLVNDSGLEVEILIGRKGTRKHRHVQKTLPLE